MQNITLERPQIDSRGYIDMSSIIGSILGASSLSALILGAVDAPIDSAGLSIVFSLVGGLMITLLAFWIDKKIYGKEA